MVYIFYDILFYNDITIIVKLIFAKNNSHKLLLCIISYNIAVINFVIIWTLKMSRKKIVYFMYFWFALRTIYGLRWNVFKT